MYQKMISDILRSKGRSDISPRHVEAFMRVEHSTLDGLTHRQFDNEVDLCIGCIDEAGIEAAEECAQSLAL